jgi:2-C-methyl-D-erythritol 2,4-cyclodiphosphate synthase
VRDLVAARGWRVVNVDCTIVAERPKIMPHAPAMRATIGDILGLPPDAVSIKATTNEGIGFIGREEGIAAMAVALLARTTPETEVTAQKTQ